MSECVKLCPDNIYKPDEVNSNCVDDCNYIGY